MPRAGEEVWKVVALGLQVRELSDPVGEYLSFEWRFFCLFFFSSVSGCGEVENLGRRMTEFPQEAENKSGREYSLHR